MFSNFKSTTTLFIIIVTLSTTVHAPPKRTREPNSKELRLIHNDFVAKRDKREIAEAEQFVNGRLYSDTVKLKVERN